MDLRRRNEIKVTDTLYLLDRVSEPIFFGKGRMGREVIFIVPVEFLTYPYTNQALKIMKQFDSFEGRKIDLTRLINDDLFRVAREIVKEAQVIRRSSTFSLFMPLQQKIVTFITDKLMSLPRISDIIVVAAYIRDRINTELFVYTYILTLMHRDETYHLRMPSNSQIFPNKFIKNNIVGRVRRVSNIFAEIASDRQTEEMTLNLSQDGNPEQRLAYFREDMGLNSHHWHWHLVYPVSGSREIIDKDRRGELFFYMHQQIVRRYNIERICNNLDRTKSLLDWSEPIQEAYFPMINNNMSGRTYASRIENMKMNDVLRPNLNIKIEELIRYKEKILEAIHRKRIITTEFSEISIDNDRGIDILGNIVEACDLSLNRNYYGSLHNLGHDLISYIHDPQNIYNQPSGVMFAPTTAMRDPIFYRWHTFINDIFEEHKNILPPYTVENLSFPAIKVNRVEISIIDNTKRYMREKNTLYTFMMKSDFNLGRGLDFSASGPSYVKIKHLNHEPYEYKINVTNVSNVTVFGTVRIFMAPNQNFKSRTINFNEQKNLMIEMDKFVVQLKPGDNNITRRSYESSLIISLQQIFYDPDIPLVEQNTNYCQCGWPEYLLLPIGSETGIPMLLFVMISDYSSDKIHNRNNTDTSNDCKSAVTFCGIKNRKYPDKRPMGYPFDRPLSNERDTIELFKTPNMAIKYVTIKHFDEVRENHFPSTFRNH